MGQVLPFNQYGVFDPATADALGLAFDEAWQHIRALASDPVTSYWEEQTRQALAAYIIKMAQAGESDPARLRDAAIAHMASAQPSPDASPVTAKKRRSSKPAEQQQQLPPGLPVLH